MALPVVLSATPMAPTVVSEPSLNDIAFLLSFLLTNYFSIFMTPETISFGERYILLVGRGTHFIRVEARDHDHYWITC